MGGGGGEGRSQRSDKNVNTRSENITRRREKINSKNSFSLGKQRQRRRRNAKGELKKQREEEAGSSDALLFPPHRVLRVLHCVGIHFNEFAFQERIILFGLVSLILVLSYFFFLSSSTFPLPIDV